MPQKPVPANAIMVGGQPYLRNAAGDLDALVNVKAIDLLEDEMVRRVVAFGEDLSAELARYSVHTDADIAAFDALLAQNYNVEPRETKGNRTFSTYDGLFKVQVAVSQRIKMGPALDDAKAVLDTMIRERGEGVDTFLITLVNRAFKVDQEGKVDVRSILALRRLEVDDPRWPDFCRAIDDAVKPDGSKRYIRLYRRDNHQAAWQMVPLDLAAVQPTPAAMERRSLRRRNEQLEAMFGDILDELGRSGITQEASVSDAVGELVDQLCTAQGELELVSQQVEALQAQIAEIDMVLERVDGRTGMNTARKVEWLLDSLAGLGGYLTSAATDHERVDAEQVLLMVPAVVGRPATTQAAE
ncbi:MAG: DUF3164 family protein [Magnetospirillum sp.]|nr:DUF3164 family protein [Magnetospirillum sp.]